MSLNFNIAIDGFSSCGKSTIAKNISKKYRMNYIDTGAMYRAFTLFCMRKGIINNKKVNESQLILCLDQVKISFKYNYLQNTSETFLNDENVEYLIRGFEVSKYVSLISQIQQVRDKLVLIQQAIGKNKNTIMDGRDIGTKVFPNAKLKFFITASTGVRARRRFDEMIKKGENISYKEVKENLISRDNNDMNRKVNPLIQADDSILIDNSFLSIKDQNSLVYSYVEKMIKHD